MVQDDLRLKLLKQIASSLQELVTWTRVMSYPTVKQMLETTLDTEQKRLVYHLMNGTRTVAAIQKLTGVNARFISEWGQEWEKIGIVEPSWRSKRKGRRQKVFELSTFGIPIPEHHTENQEV